MPEDSTGNFIEVGDRVRLREQICEAYGVPQSYLARATQSNCAQATVMQRLFCEQFVNALGKLKED